MSYAYFDFCHVALFQHKLTYYVCLYQKSTMNRKDHMCLLVLAAHLVVDRAHAKKGAGGPGPPLDMFPLLINKLSLLKTAGFVLNFKVWSP